ncbi:hypothetical protein VPH35_044385 [Triticum aestivum]
MARLTGGNLAINSPQEPRPLGKTRRCVVDAAGPRLFRAKAARPDVPGRPSAPGSAWVCRHCFRFMPAKIRLLGHDGSFFRCRCRKNRVGGLPGRGWRCSNALPRHPPPPFCLAPLCPMTTPPRGSGRARGQGPPPPRARGCPWRAFGHEAGGEYATSRGCSQGLLARSGGVEDPAGSEACGHGGERLQHQRRPAGKGRRLGRSIRSSAMREREMWEVEKEGEEV